jgi:predicted nucleotide-binding protein (sugar kinase/HSP70/actin superfamily)
MAPVHFALIKGCFERMGYNVKILEIATNQDVEVGLKFVNNDACYPAIMVIGQIINALKAGEYDLDKVAVVMSQTGGMCRASNYIGMLRMGMRAAGYGNIPVISLSTQGLEKHPGFKIGPKALLWVVRALVLGDLMQDVLYRVRPYEHKEGSANEMYHKWDKIICSWIAGDKYAGFGGTDPLSVAGSKIKRRKWNYKRIINAVVQDFNSLKLRDIDRKPRVGIVGEILVKFHPDANNHLIDVIEREGAEAVMPGIFGFMTNKLYIADWNYRNINRGTYISSRLKTLLGSLADRFLNPVRKAYAATTLPPGKRSTGGQLVGEPKFTPWVNMNKVVKYASTVTSIGVQAGEGWLLAGEIVELIHQGAPNIVCANPFACLPNHVTGRGIFSEIRRQFPHSNIVSIDYDPGASEVNQLNRIKLMLSAAKK